MRSSTAVSSARKPSGSMPNRAMSTVVPPSSEVAFRRATPTGVHSRPGADSNTASCSGVSVDRLNELTAPSRNVRWKIGRARRPEIPSSTNPLASPDSTVESRATRAIVAPTSANRALATRRSRSPRYIRSSLGTARRRTAPPDPGIVTTAPPRADRRVPGAGALWSPGHTGAPPVRRRHRRPAGPVRDPFVESAHPPHSTGVSMHPSFADLGVPAPLCAALARRGITAPYPVQAATLPDVLAGRDVAGRAPTGSGKTLAFGPAGAAQAAGAGPPT